MSLDFTLFIPVLPQILLLILALLVLLLDVILPRQQGRNLGWVTAAGIAIIMLTMIPFSPLDQPVELWGGLMRFDWMSYTFTLLFLFGAAITALLAMDYPELGGRGAPYVLLIASTIGMTFMASANDLILLYLAIETVSIPMYILTGFMVRSDESTEAGFKYLLFGAMTSALLLYGFSLIYGFTGSTYLPDILRAYASGSVPALQIIATLVLAMVGLGFKISVFPFHFWAPDVYQGAPTPVSGFLSTASKAAGFAALIRVLFLVFGAFEQVRWWMGLLAALSFATMTLGNLVAMSQKNIKRLLAYSSIAHAGYVLIGVVSFGSRLGLASVMYYLGAYLLTNLAAFAIVAAYGRAVGSDEITAYNGLSRRSPGLALAMLVAFLSLAGMPPFAGFVAKVFIFAAAVDAGQMALAIVGVLNSIIGLYYYLTVMKYVYLYRSENDDQPVPVSGSFKLAIGLLTIGILLVGVVFNPWFNWATTAAAAMIR